MDAATEAAEVFFECIRNINISEYQENFPGFTDLFKILFDLDYKSEEYKNVITWLNAGTFELNRTVKKLINANFYAQLRTFLIKHGLDKENIQINSNLFDFWTLLHWISSKLPNYAREDNVFAFMTTQKIEDVKVVIVAQDPTKKHNSTGYAFHNVNCRSTRNISKYATEEMRTIYTHMSKTFEVPEEETCDLGGWINQNVLLMNAILTYNDEDGRGNISNDESKGWKNITDFFIKKISVDGEKRKKHLVFILVGYVAYTTKEKLIDQPQHCVKILPHPSPKIHQDEPSHHAKPWSKVLPFTEANRFFQKHNPKKVAKTYLVDWDAKITGTDPNNERLKCFKKFYQ